MKRFLLICLGLLCFTAYPLRIYAMSEQEIIDRLEALTRTVAQQQKEIRYLSQQLEQQKVIAQEARAKEVAGIEKVAAKETAEKKKPEWTERVKLGGDLRLRYEGLYNREKREADGSTTDLPTRDRYRIRARLFVDGKISDEV
ncbi:MAG: putative porin, partial [Proteobacteria bacterium]|nr:putative porin [Pseudomonadota bacterium]